MKSLEIRQKFFDFFTQRGHEKVSSSSLIPAQDPTLLFANAGMNQFKDVFLGKEKRSYTRAVSIQKCVRAGGKHNDLDNVGFTKRHLTFFEMMGNFSFGDYFKKEAIVYAWDFLTKELALSSEKLHVSVYLNDDEAYALWHDTIGIPADRIHRLGAEDNFWQMGDTGPCGPCTEIHIDRGAGFGCKEPCGPACNCDRFLEIWNLVFMQFDRQPDGTDVPLKQTGVDTGMGLERLASVIQNVDSVYHTDLFTPIIARIEQLTGITYKTQNDQTQAAFHVLCDHIRSSSFLIADGCAPSNEGRGYVLRKIIRRAALFAQKLTELSIFPELSSVVVEQMGSIYPDLYTNAERIKSVLTSEINKFSANLVRGQAILQNYIQEYTHVKRIDGAQAFKLYDTYGFPTELIVLMAQEHGFTVDMNGFEQEMHKQQEQSGKKVSDELDHVKDLAPSITSEFTGYTELQTTASIGALIVGTQAVNTVPANTECWIIADRSPFFIVGGGQVPDQGWITIKNFQTPILTVRYIGNGIAARITTPTDIRVGDTITSTVHKELRINAMKNHTATHMLQAALIQLFGKGIQQSGSLVHPDYLRFDFTYHEQLSAADITNIENLVNEKIRENIPVIIKSMTMAEAIKQGALAFFGDKYNPEQVRMVGIDDFSTELCGGTHVHATGDIGTFKITEVSAPAAGLRRIVAMTGPRAIELFQQTFTTVKTLSTEFKVKREDVLDAITKQKEQIKELHTSIKALKKQIIHAQIPAWAQRITPINGIPLLYLHLDGYSTEELKEVATQLMTKKAGMYFLTSTMDNKHFFVCMLSPDLTSRIDLKKLNTWLKETYHLAGGGSQHLLQGGGQTIDQGLEAGIHKWIEKNL
ncbi:MAG: alanine--tRNA ligase [Candidatus Babeliales bacterium]